MQSTWAWTLAAQVSPRSRDARMAIKKKPISAWPLKSTLNSYARFPPTPGPTRPRSPQRPWRGARAAILARDIVGDDVLRQVVYAACREGMERWIWR